MMYTYPLFLMHSSVAGPFSHFRVLAGDNNTAMNIGMQVSFGVRVLSGYRPRSGIARSYGGSIPRFFNRTFIVPVSNLLSHLQQRRDCLLVSSPLGIDCRLCAGGHSEWCWVIPCCCLDLHVFNNEGKFGKCQQIWKTQQWPWDWKRSVFIPIPKRGNAKECSNYHTIALISHSSKVMLKILQVRLQQYMNHELSDVQAGFRKGRGTRDQIANIRWIIKKAGKFQKNIYFCFINYAKAFDCVNHNKRKNS